MLLRKNKFERLKKICFSCWWLCDQEKIANTIVRLVMSNENKIVPFFENVRFVLMFFFNRAISMHSAYWLIVLSVVSAWNETMAWPATVARCDWFIVLWSNIHKDCHPSLSLNVFTLDVRSAAQVLHMEVNNILG